MKLSHLRESISEEALLRVFSNLVQTVNSVSELIGAVKEEEDAHVQISQQIPNVEGIKQRIERLSVTDAQWKTLRPSVSNMDVGSTWLEFKAMLTRRMLPELIVSMKGIAEAPIENIDAKIAIANERVQNIQQAVVGMAPEGGVSDPETDIPEEVPNDPTPDETTPPEDAPIPGEEEGEASEDETPSEEEGDSEEESPETDQGDASISKKKPLPTEDDDEDDLDDE